MTRFHQLNSSYFCELLECYSGIEPRHKELRNRRKFVFSWIVLAEIGLKAIGLQSAEISRHCSLSPLAPLAINQAITQQQIYSRYVVNYIFFVTILILCRVSLLLNLAFSFIEEIHHAVTRSIWFRLFTWTSRMITIYRLRVYWRENDKCLFMIAVT